MKKLTNQFNAPLGSLDSESHYSCRANYSDI